jgi:hypothetical protein
MGASLPPLVLPPPPVPAPPTGSTPADGLLVATGVTDAAGAGGAVVGLTLGVGGAVVGVVGGVVVGGVVGGLVQVQVGTGLGGGVVGGVVGGLVQVHLAWTTPLVWAGDTVAADATPLNITVDPAARSGTLSAAVAISLRGRFCRKFI